MFGRLRTTAEAEGFVCDSGPRCTLPMIINSIFFCCCCEYRFLLKVSVPARCSRVSVFDFKSFLNTTRIFGWKWKPVLHEKFLCCFASAAVVCGGRCCLCVVASPVYKCCGICSAWYLMSSCNRLPIGIDKAKATELNRSAHTWTKIENYYTRKTRLRFQMSLTHLLSRLSVSRCDLFWIIIAA